MTHCERFQFPFGPAALRLDCGVALSWDICLTTKKSLPTFPSWKACRPMQSIDQDAKVFFDWWRTGTFRPLENREVSGFCLIRGGARLWTLVGCHNYWPNEKASVYMEKQVMGWSALMIFFLTKVIASELRVPLHVGLLWRQMLRMHKGELDDFGQ